MRLAFQTDAGFAERAALGLLVLQTDETIEPELHDLLNLPGVALYHSRLANAAQVSKSGLAAMADELPDSARLLPPGIDFDVIGYGCTSGATVIGETKVTDIVCQVRGEVKVSNPITATKAALRALGARRIGFVTPYVADVSAAMRENLQAAGFEIVAFGSFEEEEDAVVARISPSSILDAIMTIGENDTADAVFVSCTNLRVARVIPEAEERLGKPVISSNQALAWHMLRLAGIEDQLSGRGQLFQRELA